MTTLATRIHRPVAATVALWAAQIFAAAMFLMAGTLKLAGDPTMVQMFAAIGVGQWFRYLTGSIEVVSALLLFVPSLSFFAALTLAATMVGALATHLFVIGGNPAPALVLLVTTAAIAFVRRPR
jgi:putative oxidoreductase